jgi:type IV pilus assembly protein PilW
MSTMPSTLARRGAGFSLIELLVGMAMGVLVLLIILQSLTVAEGYRRSTTSGADAQVDGLLAMRTLESEIRMAGSGMSNRAQLCPSITTFYDNKVYSRDHMPVRITDGGTGADAIEVVYSSSLLGGAPARITKGMPAPANATKVNTTAGLAKCDFVLLAAKNGGSACNLQQVTGVTPKDGQFLTGSGQSKYNAPGGEQKDLYPSGGYKTNDLVINMGKFSDKRYSVSNTAKTDGFYLRQTNLMPNDSGCGDKDATPELDLISNIVNIQAQYGVAPAKSEVVSCWTSAGEKDNGCAISGGNWSAPAVADSQRIKAVRVAIVVRSALAEKPSVAGGSCDTTKVAPLSWDGGPAIDLSNVPNWQCYRYKVYQTAIPLINVLWADA